jgi:FkbM family methyltransferase
VTPGREESMVKPLLKKALRLGLRKYMALNHYITEKQKSHEYSKFESGHVFDVQVDDMSFKLTFMDYQLGRNIIQRIEGRREPETIAMVKALVRKGSNVLALGCCFGYFTNIMAQCAGEDGRVVSIEGTPSYYKVLERNIDLNGLQNVRAYNFFITSKESEVYFYPEDTHPYNLIKRLENQKNIPNENNTTVPAGRLSEFLEQIRFSPDCIFMDIEGFEVDVFEDFSEGYLQRHRPVIVFEIHNMYYKEKDLSFIKNILTSNNYYYRKVAANLVCFPE